MPPEIAAIIDKPHLLMAIPAVPEHAKSMAMGLAWAARRPLRWQAMASFVLPLE